MGRALARHFGTRLAVLAVLGTIGGSPAWVAAGAGAALLAFSPQMLAWKALYGTWLWFPDNDVVRGQFARFDWGAPRLVDVLLHADHGLLLWSPALALALLGLVASLRRWGVIAAVGLAVFLLTAYINGTLGTGRAATHSARGASTSYCPSSPSGRPPCCAGWRGPRWRARPSWWAWPRSGTWA